MWLSICWFHTEQGCYHLLVIIYLIPCFRQIFTLLLLLRRTRGIICEMQTAIYCALRAEGHLGLIIVLRWIYLVCTATLYYLCHAEHCLLESYYCVCHAHHLVWLVNNHHRLFVSPTGLSRSWPHKRAMHASGLKCIWSIMHCKPVVCQFRTPWILHH